MSASPSKQSVQWLKTKVRELLMPSNTDPRGEVRDDLNRTLRGWSSYFNLGSSVVALRSVDHYVRERVRRFLAGRHKVAGRGARRIRVAVVTFLIAVATGAALWFAVLRPPAVSVAEVKRGNVPDEVEGTGTVTANVIANVASKIVGRVEQVYADEGDLVQKGQILATLDQSDLHHQVKSARARLAGAEEMARELQIEANRRQRLLDEKSSGTSIEQVQLYARNYVVAQRAVEAAAHDLQLAEYNLSLTQISSLVNGLVIKRTVNVGASVVPGQQMFIVADTGLIYVNANVDQNFAGKLRKGLPATVILRGRENQPLPGHVFRISPQANAATEETVPEVAFATPPEEFQLGQWANVYIQVGEAEDALLVPRTALMTMGEKMFVFVVGADDVLRREPVTVLAESPRQSMVAVAGNLRPRERIALMPMGLTAGETVRPRPVEMKADMESGP